MFGHLESHEGKPRLPPCQSVDGHLHFSEWPEPCEQCLNVPLGGIADVPHEDSLGLGHPDLMVSTSWGLFVGVVRLDVCQLSGFSYEFYPHLAVLNNLDSKPTPTQARSGSVRKARA